MSATCVTCGGDSRPKITVSTEREVDEALRDVCWFVLYAHYDYYLCTSNEYGDFWALRFASEEDADWIPKACIIDAIPLPWVIEVLS